MREGRKCAFAPSSEAPFAPLRCAPPKKLKPHKVLSASHATPARKGDSGKRKGFFRTRGGRTEVRERGAFARTFGTPKLASKPAPRASPSAAAPRRLGSRIVLRAATPELLWGAAMRVVEREKRMGDRWSRTGQSTSPPQTPRHAPQRKARSPKCPGRACKDTLRPSGALRRRGGGAGRVNYSLLAVSRLEACPQGGAVARRAWRSIQNIVPEHGEDIVAAAKVGGWCVALEISTKEPALSSPVGEASGVGGRRPVTLPQHVRPD